MIAEAGLAALWLGAALCALQLVAAVLSLSARVERSRDTFDTAPGGTSLDFARDERGLSGLIRPVAVAQAVLTALAFACLIAVFITVDLSVKLVVENDGVGRPLMYRFSGTWGNHEGSMLMWVSILAVGGAAVALIERRLEERTLIATLGGQAVIGLGFYAFLLFASNPFARLDPAAPAGQGLNPLLEDPGLAFHPPTLYIGYVGLSIAFSFAIGALVTRDVRPAFARAMRPWVLGAWIFLTIGITAGSYWAYYELGWGGWWFWDPVENASLMPWLAATALLHSVTVLATRDGLRAWTVMLAVVAFSMSMIGTFLVRSGILTSVHAFAVDPRRGSFLLALLILYIGGALALFALRVGTVREGSRFDVVSREGALVINNLLLSVILGIVLIGTLYPLVVEAFGDKISVGPPYFNATAGPLALLLLIVMAAGPMMRWRREQLGIIARRLIVPALVLIVALVAVKALHPAIGLWPLLGLAVAAGVGLASLAPLWGRNLRRTPLHTWGMVIAHFGIAVALAGMASDSAFTQERLVAARVGETMAIGPYRVTLANIAPDFGPGWTALNATLAVKRGAGAAYELHPLARTYWTQGTQTSETAIQTVLDGQLYTVLGASAGEGRWQVRLWWKPFVTLIWAGGALVAIGGVLSLLGRLLRERRNELRKAEVWA
ncbi:cytochrome c-type biogenesis protein CcmF [Sphingomonas vulcanisoli]|uniref:Cytochrome c-type biogenesis protein CcmF n=1 Tax=Sphingomonas vulcanisoli TaxID=1658060 RepID=A0ABX0TM92_9SPHN|nr:heme lyase CcmF/NrfE family subunit [Sphingomonas vulcanisoli]NIJ06639.1 cytochrome c-type biogenesis protein CcmF [Sphingomonas vulcanisoli]